MQQVKLFSDASYAYGPNDYRNGLRNIERQINAWLAQNSDKQIIDIKFSSHSNVGGTADDFTGDDAYSAMVIYKDGDKQC